MQATKAKKGAEQDPATHPTQPPAYSQASLMGEYGISKAILDANPDLQNVLNGLLENLKNGIEYQTSDIAAMIQNTNWFRTHTADWMKIQKDRESKDPAIWDAVVASHADQLKKQFVAAGAQIDDETAKKYAEQMIYGSGWNGKSFEIYDDNWLKKTISDAIDFSKTKTINGVKVYDLAGAAQQNAEKLYDLAYSYGIDSTMSNQGFSAWFQKSLHGIMDGTVTDADIRKQAEQSAMSAFPGLSQQIARGMSVRDAADPYLNAIGQTLDMSPGSMSLNDDLVQRVLNNVDAQGNFVPMSLYDAKIAARKDSRWQYTEKAKSEYTDMASNILKDFGFLG